jgi:hypothetical protein
MESTAKNQGVQVGMTRGAIRRHLSKKIEEWAATLPDHLAKDAKNGCIVAGGAIASMLLGERVNDYDFYFESIDLAERIAKHYVGVFQPQIDAVNDLKPALLRTSVKNIFGEDETRLVLRIASAGVLGDADSQYKYFEQHPEDASGEFVEEVFRRFEANQLKASEELRRATMSDKYRPILMTDNAISLSGCIQIVIRFHGPPEIITKTFDFEHCCATYYHKRNELNVSCTTLEALLARRLVYSGSYYPLCSLFRIRKFIKRGFSITAGQMLKIAFQISSADLKNQEVLREQLIGVDAAYFSQLMEGLKSQKEVDGMYLAKLVDEVFQ